MWNPDLFDDTLHFAASAHEGQFVPGKNYSYIVHLVGVCIEALRAAVIEEVEDPNLVMQCALLHDTIEDTALTYEIILDRFGREVADGVSALTKNQDLPKKRQMEDSLERIMQQKKEIWMVKLADRAWNLREPPAHWELRKRQEYLEESQTILRLLKKASPYLAARLSDKMYNYKKFLES